MNEYEAHAYTSRALSSLHHCEATPATSARFVAPVLVDPVCSSILMTAIDAAIRAQQSIIAQANRRITDIQEFRRLCRERNAHADGSAVADTVRREVLP